MKLPRLALLVIALVLVILLVAIYALVAEYQDEIAPAASQTQVVNPGESVGQSFIARHAGLQSIDLFVVASPAAGMRDITLTVQTTEPNVQNAIEATGIVASPGWRRFSFTPIRNSRNQRYTVLVSTGYDLSADLMLRSGPGSAYHDGAMYLDGRPQAAGQLAIRLLYNPWYIALDLVVWLVEAVFVCALAVILFVLPGLALQLYLLPLPEQAWQTRLGVAAGLSLCVYPLALVWCSAAGIRLGSTVIALIVGLAIVAVGWRIWQARTGVPLSGLNAVHIRWHTIARAPDVIFIAVVVMVVLIRLFLLRGMDAPMWGDSVQHAMIGQLIADNGGLFSSWLPYAPYDSLTVHPGFHVMIALWMWATGSTSLVATSMAGQLVNILAILALVPLAQRITRSAWAGIGVVIVAGLLAPLPNGYINWGRYPQLLGQVIAPVAMWLVWRMLDGEDRPGWRSVLLAAIVFAGVFLAYYRMPHYVVIFGFVVLLIGLLRHQLDWKAVAASGVSAMAAALFVLPWLLRLRGSALGEGVDAVTVRASSLESILADYRSLLAMAEPLLGEWLIVATLVVMGVAFVTRHKTMLVIILWGGGLLCLPAARLVRLPGFNNLWVFAVLISLYMPIGLLLGAAIDILLSKARKDSYWIRHGIVALVLVAAIVGGYDRLKAYDPRYRILAPADIRAMSWIKENLPSDARIAVDGFLVYDGRSAVGSDGGWWLSLLTSRQTTMPPQYPLLAEHAIDPGYNAMVVDFTTQIRAVGISSQTGLAALCRYGITHVYVGEERGSIAMPPQISMFAIGELERSRAFMSLYREDKVAVFQFDRSLCQ